MCAQRLSCKSVSLAGRAGAIPHTGIEVPSLRLLQHQAIDNRQERTQAASAAAAAAAAQSQLSLHVAALNWRIGWREAYWPLSDVEGPLIWMH